MPTAQSAVRLENILFRMLADMPDGVTAQKGNCPAGNHDHAFFEIFACTQGVATVSTGDEEIALEGNDLIIVPPGLSHTLKSVPTGARVYAVSFLFSKKPGADGDAYSMLTPLFSASPHILRNNQHAKTIGEISESARGGGFLPALSLLQLLISLCKSGRIKTGGAEEGKTPVSSDIARLMQLDTIIEEGYPHRITAGDVAKRLHVSTRQLSRIVEKRYGKTLHALISEKRLLLAVNLLDTTKMSAEEIAVHCGFPSSPAFYREFRRAFGKTPAGYRREK